MQRLTITSCATAVPMGAEVYQEQIAGRALAALATDAGDEEGWILDRRVVRSLRSPLPGTHRLPMDGSSGPRARAGGASAMCCTRATRSSTG